MLTPLLFHIAKEAIDSAIMQKRRGKKEQKRWKEVKICKNHSYSKTT